MDYADCLRMAGATVYKYKQFGSYQGDWWALVTVNGVTGWIHDYYGSCTGCDTLYSQMSETHHEHENPSEYWDTYGDGNFREGCEECDKAKQIMIKIGSNLLEGIMDQEKAEIEAAKDKDWDMGVSEVVKFVTARDNLDGLSIFDALTTRVRMRRETE